MNEYLEFAKEIALEAGNIMKKYFSRKDISSYKGDKTIVTLADKEINSYLIKRVKESFPNHCVDGEEEQFGESKYVWVCDPVDGTAMYARNIPVAVFSLALVIDGISTVGVIYDPFTENMYSAIKGKGTYQNDVRIQVNDYNLEDMKSVSHFDMWPEADYNIFPAIQELGNKTYFIGLGSIIRACACVASGEFVSAIFPGTTHKNCDIAAAKVIVEEAGGKVTNLFGEEQRYDQSINGAIISNKKVHSEIVETLKKYVEINGGIIMNNYIITHGSFGSPFVNWFPYLRKEIEDKGLEVYTPDFPTGVGFQNYTNWSKLLKCYLEAGIINENTTIFAHSIAPIFICKFLVENKIKVKRLVFVCGFNNYLGINEDYDTVNKSMYFDNLADVKNYCDDIICFYSDNDPYVKYEVEKEFADTITENQIMISGGGHLNSESGYTEFSDLLKFI